MNFPAADSRFAVTSRTIGCAVIDQSADNACTAVGIALPEKKGIRRGILIQFDFTRTVRIPLLPFQIVQPFFQCFVADSFGITHYFVVVLLTHNFHIELNYRVNI